MNRTLNKYLYKVQLYILRIIPMLLAICHLLHTVLSHLRVNTTLLVYLGKVSIQEPTVGAGGLIVAAMEFLRSNGINYSWNCFVDCGDIDARCFFMTYLTLSLLGVPAVVRLGDALKLEYRAAWFTPAYIFGYSHFYSRLKNGDYPRAATIPKTQSETKQVTEPPTTKADKYGQLSLF